MPACRSAPAAAMPAIPAPTIAILGDVMTPSAPCSYEGSLLRLSDRNQNGADGGIAEYSPWAGRARKLDLRGRCALHGKFILRKARCACRCFQQDAARLPSFPPGSSSLYAI